MSISDWIWAIFLLILLPVGGIFLVQGIYYADLRLYYGEGSATAAGWSISWIGLLCVYHISL